jgi:hypothetical protein
MRSSFARIFGAIVVAAVIAFIVVRPDVALSQGTSLWPQATGVTLNTTASTQIIGTNPTRRWITICNVATPSTIIIWIAPSGITPAANGAGSIPLSSMSASGSTTTAACYNSPINGSEGAAWNAITPTTTPATLTVFEY